MSVSIAICSSFRFYENVLELQKVLEDAGLRCEIPIPNEFLNPQKPWRLQENLIDPEPEVFEAFWRNMRLHQDRILRCELVYVYCGSQGYVGNGVSSEMGFGYAIRKHVPTEKPKTLLSSHQISDIALQGFIEEIIGPDELVGRLNQ